MLLLRTYKLAWSMVPASEATPHADFGDTTMTKQQHIASFLDQPFMGITVPAGWAALGMLTNLTSLHALHPGARSRDSDGTPLEAVRSLSTLTALRDLRARGGAGDWRDDPTVTCRHWAAALQGQSLFCIMAVLVKPT